MKTWTKFSATAAIAMAAALPGSTLNAQPAGRSVWDGVYSPAQAIRGKAVYAAKCAMCHGTGLEGADSAPPLAGVRFIQNWKGQTVGDLATRTRTTMPLDNPGSLGLAQTADVTAYLLQANQYPKGPAELPKSGAAQQQIRINAR